MSIRLIALLSAATLAALSWPVTAEAARIPICDTRDAQVKRLAEIWKEVPTARGITSQGHMVEILTSPKGRTWTAWIVHPSGVACITASGADWRVLPERNGI